MRFSLIGCGFIAPRHLEAIKETGNELVSFCDVNDSVGIIDKYFPQAEFYTNEIEFFENLNSEYLTVCTPNDLHLKHINLGYLRGCKVICEKPLVLNEHQFNSIQGEPNVIMQLRLHEDLIKAKEQITSNHKVFVKYTTPRGKWYQKSWKGDKERSGGIIMNIGIHLIDMLMWMFGDIKGFNASIGKDEVDGILLTEKAKIHFLLSIKGEKERKMSIDNQEINFDTIENLHTKSYQEILRGNGFTKNDVYKALKIVNILGE